MQLRELVTDQRVVRDAPFRAEVFWVEPSMNRFHRYDKANAIGASGSLAVGVALQNATPSQPSATPSDN